jgi:DNA mismatch endonuclease Vsr
MRAIRSEHPGTTERRLRAVMVSAGLRGWTMHAKDMTGTPDFYFKRESVAVFVDGCFWHGCPKCGHTPKANRPYWSKKLVRNKQRDSQVRRKLSSSGIKVLRIWECQLRDEPRSCLRKLSMLLERAPRHP